MPNRATILLAGCLIAIGANACGGKAIGHTRGDSTPFGTKDGGDQAASDTPNPSSSDGGMCSLPVGSLATGCPMLLTPRCAWSNGGMSYGEVLCDLPLDFGGPVEPEFIDSIDVQFGTSWESSSRMLRVAGPESCSATGNGWYFDDAQHPTTIHICPNACECAKSEPGTFSLVYGCLVNAAPGVVETAIACPRCAATRPKSCPVASAEYVDAFTKCEFSAPSDFNPAIWNLKYAQHPGAGPEESSDGFLTFVPSLADCDSVEEGWTLDFSTDPPTVLVCPSACSCAKLNGAWLVMERGCPRYDGTAYGDALEPDGRNPTRRQPL